MWLKRLRPKKQYLKILYTLVYDRVATNKDVQSLELRYDFI